MDVGEYKRSRDMNYTPYEKKLIVKLVKERKDVIESMKTDMITNRQKMKAWIEIRDIVNARCGTQRTWQSCRSFWGNVKKRYRKAHADRMKELREKSEIVEKIETDDSFNRQLIQRSLEEELLEFDDSSDVDEKPMLFNLISPASKQKNRELTSGKKPYVLFIDNAQTIEDLQSSVRKANGSIALPQTEDSSELFSIADSSDLVDRSELSSLRTRLMHTDKLKASVKDVAVSTEGNAEERRKEKIHSLLVREKEIKIQILELELMRKRLELERDFSD